MHIMNTTSSMGMRVDVAVNHQSNDNNTKSNTQRSGNSDTLSISKSAKTALQNQSKIGGVIDSLLKQKQNIIDSKNSLIERTTENAHNLDSIQDQLKEFDKQLQTIDQQIAKYNFKDQQKGFENGQKADQKNEPKTEQEIQNERLNTIVSVSQDISQIEVVSSTQHKMQGEARILTKEIELDEKRSSQPATSKREHLSKIEERISDMNEKLGEALKDTGEALKDTGEQIKEQSIEQTEKIASYKEIQRFAEESAKPQLEILA